MGAAWRRRDFRPPVCTRPALRARAHLDGANLFLGLSIRQISARTLAFPPQISFRSRAPTSSGSISSPMPFSIFFTKRRLVRGGDIVSGFAAGCTGRRTGMHHRRADQCRSGPGKFRWLLACAGAAGPALEGGVVERGMQAFFPARSDGCGSTRGASSLIRVIGDLKPRGICGSQGSSDLVADKVCRGVLTGPGKSILDPAQAQSANTPDGWTYYAGPGSQSGDGREICVSEIDMGFFEVKAACTHIVGYFGQGGAEVRAVRRDLYCRYFGNRIDAEMPVRIGMIPTCPDVYGGIGNSSVRGHPWPFSTAPC